MTIVRLHFAGALLTTWIVLGTQAYGQYSRQGEFGSSNACISGEIAFDGDASNLMVVLGSSGGPILLPQSVPVTGMGTFDLGCVKEGVYQLRILSRAGAVVHEEFVTAGPGYNPVTIHLAKTHAPSPHSQSVSLHELRRKVNRKAASEVRKAREMRQRSQVKAAMTHVMKALEKDPSYVDAHIEAGIIHAVLNDHEQAVVAFRKAADLDPASVLAHNNLAVELLKLMQYRDAEHAARRALQLDHTRRSMEYVLGASLSHQGRNPEEALKYLRRAVAEYPRARLVAAKVLFETGEQNEAISELRLYLTSNVEAAERARIEAWLAGAQ